MNTAAFNSDLFVFEVAVEDCSPTALSLASSPSLPSSTLTSIEQNVAGSTQMTTHLNLFTDEDTFATPGTYVVTITIEIESQTQTGTFNLIIRPSCDGATIVSTPSVTLPATFSYDIS